MNLLLAQSTFFPRVTLIARGQDKGRQIVNKKEMIQSMYDVEHTNVTTAVMEHLSLSKQILVLLLDMFIHVRTRQ